MLPGRRCWLFSVAVAAFVAFSGIAATPSIRRCEPLALTIGGTNTLTLIGDDLEAVSNLWTSFASTAQLQKAENARATFQVVVPKETPLGIGALRASGGGRSSSLHLLFLDDLTSTNAGKAHTTISNAFSLKPGTAADAVYDETGFHYYKLTAKRGERLSFEIVSQRLGNPFDSMMRLLDDAGKELAWCDDDPGIGTDGRFSYEFKKSGAYILEVRDTGYQSSSQAWYHLRVGQFPLINGPWPAGGRRADKVRFTFSGTEARNLKPIDVTLPATGSVSHISATGSDYRSAGYANVLLGEDQEFLDIEPNDSLPAAQKIALPCVIEGRFAQKQDKDFFSFTVAKGERVVVRSQTRSLQSPCDAFLRFLKPDGSAILESTPAAVEPGLTNRFEIAGTYLLSIQELSGQSGPKCFYRLELNRSAPPFRLMVDTDAVQLATNGTFRLKVTALRTNGFSGPIKLTLEGLKAQLENDTIPEKKNETDLQVKLETGAMVPVHFGMKGSAKVGEEEETVQVSTAPALKKLFPSLFFVPIEWDGLIALGRP